MNSLTMLGQLQAAHAISDRFRGKQPCARDQMEEADRLKRAIEDYVCTARKGDATVKGVMAEFEISSSTARCHLNELTNQRRIKMISCIPRVWTRRD